MFFDEIIGGAFKDFVRGGFAGALSSIGMSHFAPRMADVGIDFVAVGTRSERSGTADRIRSDFLRSCGDTGLRAMYGETVWREMLAQCDVDVLFVATPDHLHFRAIMEALDAGVHVITEKPMCLKTAEADAIISRAAETKRIVAVDMHKRYDPFVRELMTNSIVKYDRINRVRAVLEEPLEVSTEVFAWAEDSNPFSYVGCHWVDVVSHYLKVKPRALYATGEKNLLRHWDQYSHRIAELQGTDTSRFRSTESIDAWDAFNVNVTYDNGMRGDFNNNWINPAEFEGAVNQEIEVYGVLGRGIVDQQDRGFRETITGDGTRTRNPLFGSRIGGTGGEPELFGYGKASIVAGLLAIARAEFEGATAEELGDSYPHAESQRDVTMILEAAAVVAERNDSRFKSDGCAPATAQIEEDSIVLLDPLADGAEIVYRRG